MAASSQPPAGSSPLLAHLEQTLQAARDAYGPASPRGRIRLHTLFSTPRPCRDLYPYAHVFPQDASRTASSHPIDAFVEHIFVTAAWSEGGDGPGKLMYALECFLYTLPSHRAAILYVSKIDSSGWAPDVPSFKLWPFLASRPEPSAKGTFSATRILTRAFLAYFAGLEHWRSPSSCTVEHISIHILARAQHAYLFPSSPENPRKRILSDGGLIQWWRAVVSESLAEAKAARRVALEARPYYLIPGYSRLDSHILLPLPGTAGASSSGALTEAGWRYGHPYSAKGASLEAGEELPPLPLFGPSFVTSAKQAAASHPGINYAASDGGESPSIAVLMPHFSDDPKSRFIDELARDAHEQVGPMTGRRVEKRAAATEGAEEDAPEVKRQRTGEGVEATPSSAPRRKFTAAHRAAVLERQALDETSADEFWERMGFRQECCSGNAVGVFVVLITRRGGEVAAGKVGPPPAQRLALPHPAVQDLAFKSLMLDACEWNKEDEARRLTVAWEEAIAKALRRKGGLGSEGLGSRPRLDELSRGLVWSEVVMDKGASVEEVKEAQLAWEEAEKQKAGAGATSAPVNTLSVKRKKKAAATA